MLVWLYNCLISNSTHNAELVKWKCIFMANKHKKKIKIPRDHYEKIAWLQDQSVCGIDEVGRGCLAGPVVAAAVILAPHKRSSKIKDSKILTPEQRDEAYAWIVKNGWYGVGIACNQTIDTYNIYQATLIAMRKATMNLFSICPLKPHSIIIDAMPLNLAHTAYHDISIYHFPFGDERSVSIAAASIIAKVTRDKMMKRLSPYFPGFYLEKHKGYSTPVHKKAVFELGKTIIHRENFLKFLDITDEEHHESNEQQTICGSY